jgi:hypothetical protein
MPLQSPVAVNASILGPAPSGLGQYALGLIQSLDPLREGLVVYTSYREKELGEAFGWATERGELNVAERRDASILFEASLGLDQLPPVPLEARERYQKRVRRVMRRARRDLAKYRKGLLTESRTKEGRGRSRT